MKSDAVNLALLVFRASVGGIMLAHGINHIFGGGKIAGTAGWFESLGMKPGKLHAWLASLTEVGVAALLFVGLATPVAAAGVIGVMTVALVTNHWKNGFFIFRPGEGWEYVAMLIASGFLLGAMGAGRWSLDWKVEIFETPPALTGLAVAVGLGVGGAVVLLAAFWRPPQPEPSADEV